MYDNIIDNYTDRATKNMDRKRREDIRKELKSHIMDSAEALAAKQNKPIDEAIIREVIAKMGSPEEFASSYAPGKKSVLSDKVVLGGVAVLVVFFVVVGALWVVSEQVIRLGAQVGDAFTTEHRTDSTSYPAAGNISIDLDDFNGNVDIVESDTGNVEVIYDVHGSSGKLGEIVTNTTYSRAGDTLKVVSEARKRDNGIFSHIHLGFYILPAADATVKVPRDSRYKLDLTTSDGHVTVTALNGSSMVVNDDLGSIEIYGGNYDSIDARTSFGSIKADYNARDAKFKSNSGGIDLNSNGAGDSLTATTDMGTIKAKYNAKKATFHSSSGSIDLESAGAGDSLTATTDMGTIIAKYNATDATFKSSSGGINLESSGAGDSLSATTDMGRIDAKYNAKKATFHSSSGSIDLDSAGTAGTLSATTDMGSIKVTVPDGTLFSADAQTDMGRIVHDSIAMVMTTYANNHFVGYTKDGEGALKMTLKTNSGSIEMSY